MKKIFLFIFFSYFLFFFLIPPFQTPDEQGHFEVVYWVAHVIYPTVPKRFTPNPHAYSNDIASLFSLGIEHPMNILNFQKIQNSYLQQQNAYTAKQRNAFRAESEQAYNPPVYYSIGAVFLWIANLLHTSLLTQFYFVRLASTLFYFATIATSYKILALLFSKQQSTQALLLFFALNPLLLQSGIGISPDIAIMFFATLFFWYVMRVTKSKHLWNKKTYLIAGLIAGLATLTKISGIFLLPTFAVYLFVKKRDNKQWFLGTSIFCLTFVITQIPWVLLNLVRYHTLVMGEAALGPATQISVTSFPRASISALFEFRHTILHFSGFLGQNDVYPFPPVFTLYTVGFIAFLLIGMYACWKGKNTNERLLIFAFGSLFLFFYCLSFVRKLNYPGWGIGGRNVLPVFLPMTLFVASGLSKALKRPLDRVAPFLGYFAIFYYYFVFVFVLLPRYYV